MSMCVTNDAMATTMTSLLSLLLASVMVLQVCNTCNAFSTSEPPNVPFRHPATALSAASSSNSRRALLNTLVVVGSTASLFSPTHPALAAYGDSSNLKGFDYIEYLVEKNAVADPSTFVYKGADRATQLQRIKDSIVALQQIPDIARNRKWSQVNGVLTGPLGTLVATMNQVISPTTETTRSDFGSAPLPNKEAKAASQKVKADLYAISQAATQKNEGACIQATEAALQDLEAFVKVAF